MWPLLLLGLVAVVVVKLVNLHFYWGKHGVPYEPYYRYLYRVLWLYRSRSLNEVAREDVQRYGTMYGSYRGFQPSLVVADAELAKDVLIKQFGNFFSRSFEFHSGDPLWDNTLNHLDYDKWKTVRTVMGQTFTSSKMRAMAPKLDKVATRVVAKLGAISKSSKNEVELNAFLNAYGMDSMAAISFGIDLDCIENPDSDFVKYGSNLFKANIITTLMLSFPSLIKYLPLVHFPPKPMSKFFGELGKHVLAEKRKNLDEVIKNKSADIIDHHLIAQREDTTKQITDEILASQTFMFFIGGLDTTVLALDMATYQLTVNPDVQQRVYEEIIRIMGDRTEPTYEDLQKMKLLEASILEAMRISPITFIFDRVCTEDTQVAGVLIKKGMSVEIPLPYIHLNPAYFPEPDRYLPERFLVGGEVSSELSAFLTFGDGPKNCVGRRLAIMNMQMLLAKMLLKLRLDRCNSTPVPLRVKPGLQFSNISRDPIMVKLVPRK